MVRRSYDKLPWTAIASHRAGKTKDTTIADYEFVEFIPDELKERTLYISVTYCTAVHKCWCGCGREVVTPLSPTGWQLIFDGKTVSLYPSIGSWSLPCQSHYFITKNNVAWAQRWTKKQIERGRAQEGGPRETYYASTQRPTDAPETPSTWTLGSQGEGKHLATYKPVDPRFRKRKPLME